MQFVLNEEITIGEKIMYSIIKKGQNKVQFKLGANGRMKYLISHGQSAF